MLDLLHQIPTAFLFFAAAALILVLPKGVLRNIILLGTPILAGFQIWTLGLGSFVSIPFFGFELDLMRIDSLSRVFVVMFCVAAFLGNLFAWHLRDSVQQVATMIYAGSAIGAVLAGDMLTLFFFWEGTAIASVFLIWARGTEGAYHTGMRYLIIQITSGVVLIAGVTLFYTDTGSFAFTKMELGSLATWLIFLSFGIKCAFPLLNNWLQDSYPAATITGTVILSAFTTKLAVYALARGFAGTEILIYIGAIMALVPILFALIENDMRLVLAYSLNSQLGFMVVGVGIGTELALNGAVSHAFASVLYKALLFMSVGAVMYRTGTAKASELGGLYRTMPKTALLCIVGAASIAAMPFFSGFVTKSMTLSAVAYEKHSVIWLILVFASVAAVAHTSIRIPFSIFFGQDSGKRPAEAPTHMLCAMGLTAALCIFVGSFPDVFYMILPFDLNYHSYTTAHVAKQLQLITFALLAFAVMYRAGFYPRSIRALNLDTDVIYRKVLPSILGYAVFVISNIFRAGTGMINTSAARMVNRLHHSHGPDGSRAASWPAGAMVMSIAALLGLALFVIFFS